MRANSDGLPHAASPSSIAVPYRVVTAYATPNADDSETAPDNTPGLIEYWRILSRRKGTVVIAAFLGAALGLLVTLPQTPIYQAKAIVEVQDINRDSSTLRQTTPESQIYSALTDMQTQIRIIQSETVKKGTIAKLKQTLAADLKPQQSRLSIWRSALNLPEPQNANGRDLMLRTIANNMRVRVAGQTRIMEILVDSTDRELAAKFANTAVDEYIDQNTEARFKMSQRTGDWLARQLDDMRVKLERSEDALQSYARQAGLVFTGGSNDRDDRRTNISEEKLRQVQQALSSASADRVAKQSRYEMAKNSPPDALPDVLNDIALREYQKDLTQLQRQLAEASAMYTPEFPKVQRLQVQLDTLEKALARERSAIINRIRNDYEEAVRRENLLAADYARQARTVTGEGEKSIQYGILKREVDSDRQLYDSMLQRVRESGIASALKASNIRVVDPATPPEYPYKPNKTINIAIGLFAGLVAGIGLIVVRDRADRTLQGPGDTTQWLKIPELGTIPSAKAETRGRLYGYAKKHNEISPSSAMNGSGLPERVELVTHQRRPSVISEAFRTVLTSILFAGKNGHRPHVIVLTSSNPSEGKTTVSSNLAIALAELRRRVLLIDADLRRPRIHDIFQIDNDRGLSDILREAEPNLTGIIHETRIPGLFVLPSGPPTAAASNLLFADHMPELLRRFRQEFDMVVIDTPPMLQMPDARVVGQMADGVILVVRAGHTTRDAALAAVQRLTDDDIRIVGTILNDWNPHSSPNGYYRSYKAGAYYGNYGRAPQNK